MLGSYVWSFKGKLGLQVRDLNRDGLEEIFCATSDGASLGAYVRVFRAHAGQLVTIPPTDEGGYDFGFVEASGKSELVLCGKCTEGALATVTALRLEGAH